MAQITINQEINDKSDFIIQSKDGRIFKISEGTGDNLLDEDVANGYVDYINYDYYDTLNDLADGNSHDGGMVLLKKNYADMTLEEILHSMAYEEDTSFMLDGKEID